MVALRVSSLLPCAAPQAPRRPAKRSLQGGRQRVGPVAAHTVTVEHKGKTHKLSIEGDATILEAALDAGIELPHDCKMGVCMTCPAKLISGEVDQSGGSMLSDDVQEQGYVLVCASRPLSDCLVKTVPEEELLQLQLG